jgi:ferredoxin-NADP reductase
MKNNNKNSHYPAYNDSDILCQCMKLKRSEVSPILKYNYKKIDSLIACSGAGSVCTACHPLLSELIGNDVWVDVEVSSIKKLSDYTKIFRFKSKSKTFYPAKAGQHIIVQAYIKGKWEMRRYTLSNSAGETHYREITVQREPFGKFSGYLHGLSNSDDKTFIRISEPMGDVTPNLVTAKPLICLVGGIGITPVMAFLKTIDSEIGDSRQILIDYSVLNQYRVVYQTELNDIAASNPNIDINIRVTDQSERINQIHIEKFLKNYPDADIYICSSVPYSTAVLNYLSKAKVNKKRIHIENFSSPESHKVNQSKKYAYIAILLFLAFFAQELFNWKLSGLEALQDNENYKIYSGLGLVVYIVSQFVMAYNRKCETPHVPASRYRQHKLRGAFAPLVFFIHSTQLGGAYLLLLSSVYFANFLVGIFNHEHIKQAAQRIRYFKLWLPIHISLSLLLLSLVGFHIYIVASY